MASITVRDLDERTTRLLRIRAARHGRSIEAEARAIVVAEVEPDNILMRLHERFAELGGVDLDIPPRDGSIRVVEFD